jgi:hypothetical protein
MINFRSPTASPIPSHRPPWQGLIHSAGRNRHYSGFRIRRFAQLVTPLAGGGHEPPLGEALRRQTSLLATLLHSGAPAATYDLRVLSHPDPGSPARGRLEVALLCRLAPATATDAEEHTVQLLRFLATLYPEWEWEPLEAAEVRAMLCPFRTRHMGVVRRRAGLRPLEVATNVARGPIGFSPGSVTAPSARGGDATIEIRPYGVPSSGFDALFSLLLHEPAPVCISWRLARASLRPGERQAIEEQILTCERHAQLQLGTVSDRSGDLGWLVPSLRERARASLNELSWMLSSVDAGAALLSTEIASPCPISPVVTGAVGTLLSHASGAAGSNGAAGERQALPGAFEVVSPPGRRARWAFHTAAFALPPYAELRPAEQRLPYLFDVQSAAAAFRLPVPLQEELPGIESRRWKRLVPPRRLPESGARLGRSVEPGATREVRIAPEDRLRHVYVLGRTGTGKSTMLLRMILDDIEAGEGVGVIDPHGDLHTEILKRIPDHRIDDVVLLDPTDVEHPVGLNLLETASEKERHFVVQEFVAILERLLEDQYGTHAQSYTGPYFYQHVRNSLLLVTSDPDRQGTLLDFVEIYQKPDAWKRWLPLKVTDPRLTTWVEHVLPNSDMHARRPGEISLGEYIGSKFEEFIFDPLLRGIFTQPRSTIRLTEILDSGKILLVNLARGVLSALSACFLGMIVLAKLQAAALGRAGTPATQRRPFRLYVDEFQSVATENFVSLLSETRKFGLSMVLANQFQGQVANPRIMEAVLGNVGTLVGFRMGPADAERLTMAFAPTLNASDLVRLPNWHAYASLLAEGEPLAPFTIRTVPVENSDDEQRAERVRWRSRLQYGRGAAAGVPFDLLHSHHPAAGNGRS